MRTLLLVIVYLIASCNSPTTLHPVSVQQFSDFVVATDYVTDAEKYGWSIVQEDITNFRTEEGATWRKPNANTIAKKNYPVTQVSYNDAVAYCKWAGVRLPSYSEYWDATASDQRSIVFEKDTIEELGYINVVGNVWDITTDTNLKGEIRLAGGSYLCSPVTCNGTLPERQLYVDKETGNTHIGFSVIKD